MTSKEKRTVTGSLSLYLKGEMKDEYGLFCSSVFGAFLLGFAVCFIIGVILTMKNDTKRNSFHQH